MSNKAINDEQYGKFLIRVGELGNRVRDGRRPFGPVMDAIQAIIEDELFGRELTEEHDVKVAYDYGIHSLLDHFPAVRGAEHLHRCLKPTGSGEAMVRLYLRRYREDVSRREADLKNPGLRPADLWEAASLLRAVQLEGSLIFGEVDRERDVLCIRLQTEAKGSWMKGSLSTVWWESKFTRGTWFAYVAEEQNPIPPM
jgi:hypothetical protein